MKTTFFANIVDGIITIDELTDNYIRCSVTGEMRPPEEFGPIDHPVRTNCEKAYQMPFNLMLETTQKTKDLMYSFAFRQTVMTVAQKNAQHYFEQTAIDDAIPVDILITALQRLKARYPNAKVALFIDQGGYDDCTSSPDLHFDAPRFGNVYAL